MRGKPLTATFYVGGKQVDRLTEEQLQRMADRLSEVMSRAYSLDIEEFKKIKVDNSKENSDVQNRRSDSRL